MSEHRVTRGRAAWSAAGWCLALTLAVGGCSAGGGGAASPPAGPPTPAGTTSPTTAPPPSSAASSTSVRAFTQDPVDAAFAKRLGALCNEWNSFASSHPYPGAANPQAATVEELPKIGAWIKALTINHELVAKATGLGTPAKGAIAWARVLEDFAQYEKAVATAAQAADAADVHAWQSAQDSWNAARDSVREDLTVAGIGAQSSCSLPFIRPAGHG